MYESTRPADSARPPRENPFRLLGLSALATSEEICDTARECLDALENGRELDTGLDPLGGTPPRRDVASMKEAIQRLADPTIRIRERLLWVFHVGRAPEPALRAHDEAVEGLRSQAARDPAGTATAAWRSVLRSWADVVGQEPVWEAIRRAEATGGFQEPASADQLAELRAGAMALGAGPLLTAAARAAEKGDAAEVRRVLDLLVGVEGLSEQRDELRAAVGASLVGAIGQLCSEIRQELVRRIKGGPENAASIQHACDLTLARFDAEVVKRLKLLAEEVGDESEAGTAGRDAAALLLNAVASGYARAAAYDEAVRVLRRAEEMAKGSSVTARVQGSLRNMRERADRHHSVQVGTGEAPPARARQAPRVERTSRPRERRVAPTPALAQRPRPRKRPKAREPYAPSAPARPRRRRRLVGWVRTGIAVAAMAVLVVGSSYGRNVLQGIWQATLGRPAAPAATRPEPVREVVPPAKAAEPKELTPVRPVESTTPPPVARHERIPSAPGGVALADSVSLGEPSFETPTPDVTASEDPPILSNPSDEDGAATRIPSLIPHDAPPVLENAAEVRDLLRKLYTPKLRESGLSGSVSVWVFVDSLGRSTKTRIRRSSGSPQLDRVAEQVAGRMEFRPAMNRDRRVGVWAAQEIHFVIR